MTTLNKKQILNLLKDNGFAALFFEAEDSYQEEVMITVEGRSTSIISNTASSVLAEANSFKLSRESEARAAKLFYGKVESGYAPTIHDEF